MKIKYLNRDVLAGFDKYKYNAIDTSPVSNYITHPFWNWLVEFCPRWVAPNALTLGGFMHLIVHFIVLCFYDPVFLASSDNAADHPPLPRWIWLFSSLCIFLAHTLDGIDGKQARRTGTSSPLGEMFDHGLDSWITLYMALAIVSVFGVGNEYSVPATHLMYILMNVQMTFIVSHWEKYNTGVLYLPWGYDISQIGMAGALLITYFGDYTFWNIKVFGMSAGLFFELGMITSTLLMSLPVSLYNVYLSYRDGTGMGHGPWESVRPLLDTIILYALFLTWMFHSPNHVIHSHPRLMLFACGTVFSNIACRLIVSGMSKTRCETLNSLLWPLAGIVAAVYYTQSAPLEMWLLWLYAGLVLASHLHYGCCVVDQLADHLNVYIFSTSKPPPKPDSDKKL